MVLSVISDNDQPIYDYRAPRSDHINQVARFWSRAFIYLPAVALAVIFAADLLTFYCQSSPFRYEHAIPADDVLRDAGVKLWRTSAATFLCFTLVVYISQLADRFDDATLACLRIYFPEAQEDALVGLVVHNEETSDGGGAT